MECLLCGIKFSGDRDLSYCGECWSTLEKGNIPPVNFKEYFSDGLEEKLGDINSLLFNMPEHFFIWYLKGHLEHELGSVKKALRSINTSISYKDDFGDAWVRLGLIYSDMHHEVEAIEDFQKGLRYTLIDPTNLTDAGISLQAAEHPELAAKFFNRTLDLNPEDDRAIVSLGKVYSQMDKIGEAQEILNRGLELYPHNEEMLRAMAQLFIKKNELEGAMEMYGFILDQHPRDFEALLAMGEINLRMGSLNQSIKFYNAVRDLDLHISWTGIMKFIVRNLQEIMERNHNSPSYREDLKKEYQNILLYLDDLDRKCDSDTGPDLLTEIENLIRVLENQISGLKDSSHQFKDLLKTYKVEDSFHKHLQTKVTDLDRYISEKRIFDSKQITLELSPFLTDLKEVDETTEKELRERIITRMKDLTDLGLRNEDLQEKLDEVHKLETENNLESATFLLKELDISLDEFWNEEGRKYHQEKYEEMRSMVNDAKNNFDTSSLTKMVEEFKYIIKEGPRSLLNAYQEFLKQYERDSSAYYMREGERLFQEIKYKLMLMEKDGSDVSQLFKDLEETRERREGMSPKKVFTAASELFDRVGEKEKKHSLTMVNDRLKKIGRLMDDIDSLDMENILSIHVEPVRKVIERALENRNFHLAEILTNELYENVDKLLRDNYAKPMNEALERIERNLDRLGKLGIERTEWSESLASLKEALASHPGDNMIGSISRMAFLQSGIEQYMSDKLLGEFHGKLDDCMKLLTEGSEYGFDMMDDGSEIQTLEDRSVDGITIDLLEEVFTLEIRIEKKIRTFLKERTIKLNEESKNHSKNMTARGADSRKIMEIMAQVSKSEVLLENNNFRESFEIATEGRERLKLMEKDLVKLELDRNIKSISNHLVRGVELSVDMSDFEGRYEAVSKLDREKAREFSDEVESLLADIEIYLRSQILGLFKETRETYRKFRKKNRDLLSSNLREMMKTQLQKLDKTIQEGDIDEISEEFKAAGNLYQRCVRKVNEKSLLQRASEIIESGLKVEDDSTRDIIASTQELVSRIKEGKAEGADEELKSLRSHMDSAVAIYQLKKIDVLMEELEKLDDLSNEVLENLDDRKFRERLRSINREIKKQMDRTISLHERTDAEVVEEIAEKIDLLKGDIIELENEWRGKVKIDALQRAGEIDKESVPSKLRFALESVEESYDSRDWPTFFRTWERMEGILKNLSKTKNQKKPVQTLIDEILGNGYSGIRRGREAGIPVKDELMTDRQFPGKMDAKRGIEKIASQAFVKSKKMEYDQEYPLNRAEEEARSIGNSGRVDKVKGENNLAGVAKLIAGARIDDLRRIDSSATADREVKYPSTSKVKDHEEAIKQGRETERRVQTLMEGLLDLDTSAGSLKVESDTDKLKKKLEDLFSRMPDLHQLSDSKYHYLEGVKYLDNMNEAKARKEFKVAISSALKICKVHSEMGKALAKIKKTLEGVKEKGMNVNGIMKLYEKASIEYHQGRLVECTETIGKIKESLRSIIPQ
ncbi:MAG: tetratricopeptide repeat protein [Thermoplasmatota archaeon]